jgi:hypothetical protein
MKRLPQTLLAGVSSALLLLLGTGCAFNVWRVKQVPAAFTPASDSPSFVLAKETKVNPGGGFATVLKANTTWNQVGVTEQGTVYGTKDQVVKVEASNIYEAYLVLSNSCLTGFYLPVEKTVVPLSNPLPLDMQSKQ